MKAETKMKLKYIVIPLVVGGISSFLTKDGMKEIQELNQPALSPPGWIFPVVWTILYIMMGLASYYIAVSEHEGKGEAMWLYWIQLGVNFLWSIFFFCGKWFLFSFFWLLFLWALIVACILAFKMVDKKSAWLMVPYLAWVTFAGYLNMGIYMLNP